MHFLGTDSNITWKELTIQIAQQIKTQKVLDQSAKLAFYFLLSLFPLLLILVTVFGMLLSSRTEFQQTIQTYMMTIVPPSASDLINSFLAEISAKQSSLNLTFGLVFTAWSAMHGMLALIEGLNLIYEVEESRKWWKRYLVSFGLTIVILFLNVLTIFILVYGPLVSQFVFKSMGIGSLGLGFWSTSQWILLIFFVVITLNLIYRYGPNIKATSTFWQTPGTYIGLTLWLIVSYGFKLYISYFNHYSLTYGSIGTVIVLMLWLYLSGASVLVGGIINSVIKKLGEGQPATARY